jgi:catechol 2,3-dioxygenase-like lactoylglutathione lyase family enzyme
MILDSWNHRTQALPWVRSRKTVGSRISKEETRMKRFHLHVSVADLNASIRFYSTLFGSQPTVRQSDYAKWMLEDPRINFAISTRRQPVGVNHLGLQVDSSEELRGMHAQLQTADAQLVQENEQACCYARSDKYWVTDPTGIAWETFHTLGNIPVYGEDTQVFNHGTSTVPVQNESAPAKATCCVPAGRTESKAEGSDCCASLEPREFASSTG